MIRNIRRFLTVYQIYYFLQLWLEFQSAAEATANKIEKSLSNPAAHPFLGKVPDEGELAGLGYRFVVVQNYLIFYTIEGHVILVHRIIHGARDYLSLLY